MHEHYYEIYETFKKCFPKEKDNIADWRPSVKNEIVVYLKNGDALYFNGINKSFGYLKHYDVDERGDYIISDEDLKIEFGNKLSRLMYARHMNQRSLSERTGIASPVISHYITGRNLPDFKNLRRLAAALECSVSELTDFD